MPRKDGSLSFYFFDIDDNLLFLPTSIYLWNAETKQERAVGSGEFAHIQNQLGRAGQWQYWQVRDASFRDFRDRPGVAIREQTFISDLSKAIASESNAWRGPSWPLLLHAAAQQRPVAMVTARGHAPETIESGLKILVEQKYLPALPPIVGIYSVTNPAVRSLLGADDPAMTVPSVKKMAIRHAVEAALATYGSAPPHRFGMSDDDPNNVVLAISAMRDCKVSHPDKRFFVINTNHDEFVKLEVFPMMHPVTAGAAKRRVLADDHDGADPAETLISGGNASIYVSDMDRAIHFYTEVLGLKLQVRIGNEWAEIAAGKGLVLGLHPARPPATPAPGTAGAINIELAVTTSLDDVVESLTQKGVQFREPIANYENVRLAALADPDGNGLLLAQVLHGGAPNK